MGTKRKILLKNTTIPIYKCSGSKKTTRTHIIKATLIQSMLKKIEQKYQVKKKVLVVIKFKVISSIPPQKKSVLFSTSVLEEISKKILSC